MGKVGSTSIVRSLSPLKKHRSIYHSHLLTWDRIRETEIDRKKYFLSDRHSHLQRPWKNAFIRKQIEKGFVGGKWKVISLVRDPVARNISTFFENSEVSYSDETSKYSVSSEYYGFKDVVCTPDNIDDLISTYFNKFKHDSPLTFFDNEIKKVLGFDIYDTIFDKENGYSIYHEDYFDLMIIRLEDLNNIAQSAFKKFLDIDNFVLTNANIGSQKKYAEIYKRMKKFIRFPDEYIDKFYSSKFIKHFYTNSEIENFRNRWIK